MKKALLLGIALLFVSGVAVAQLPPVGYIGLYTDEARTSSCITGTGMYPFEMWIWCLPSVNGQMCAEFMITYPTNLIVSTLTTSELICVTLGTLDTGMSACLCTCTYDWTWFFHQTLYVTDASLTEITIVKHPDPLIECVQFASCLDGLPTECVMVFTKLLVNQECPPENPVDTEDASWGAIKDQFK